MKSCSSKSRFLIETRFLEWGLLISGMELIYTRNHPWLGIKIDFHTSNIRRIWHNKKMNHRFGLNHRHRNHLLTTVYTLKLNTYVSHTKYQNVTIEINAIKHEKRVNKVNDRLHSGKFGPWCRNDGVRKEVGYSQVQHLKSRRWERRQPCLYWPVSAPVVHPELLDWDAECDKVEERSNPAVERVLLVARVHVLLEQGQVTVLLLV